MMDWLEATSHRCSLCGHLRVDHPTPYTCAIEGCSCGEYSEEEVSDAQRGFERAEDDADARAKEVLG